MSRQSFDLELEHACVELTRDADFIACATPQLIARNRELIEEARERLNDALAKVERIAA
jgi:hypothetical protein